MGQVVQYLPSKREALSSSRSTIKKKKDGISTNVFGTSVEN
jgi:hypothetical protein